MWFEDRLRQHVELIGLINSGDVVLVACSGGLDSISLAVALTSLRATLGFEILLAHVDHGLRSDSHLDYALVEELAGKLGVKFVSCRLELLEKLGHGAGAIEETARNLRYEFFSEAAQESGATCVATAHHSDDQVETVLFRIMRGTGIGGLSGIPETRELPGGARLIRPFLPFSRKDIEKYASENKLQFREDSTNSDVKFKRNFIRHKILPMLESIAPDVRESVLRLAGIARNATEILTRHAGDLVKNARIQGEDVPSFQVAALKNVDIYMTGFVLDDALKTLGAGRGGLTRNHYEEFHKLTKQDGAHGRVSLPGSVSAVLDRGVLRIMKNWKQDIPLEVELPLHGSVVFGNWEFTASPVEMNNNARRMFYSDKSPFEEIIALSAAEGGLRIRTRKNGDRFYPLGAPGTRKLGDFLTDLKVPLYERKRLPLVSNGSEVLWVVGYRISESAKTMPENGPCIRLIARKRL